MNLKNKLATPFYALLAALLLIGTSGISHAEADAAAVTKHKLVIQVSSDDPKTQTIALNNAANLQKLYGMDNVDIEIVSYGPGLGLMTAKSELTGRVKSMALQDIKFSACQNTMNKVKAKTGKEPKLTEGVGTVQAGVARIVELQEQGYAYIRP